MGKHCSAIVRCADFLLVFISHMSCKTDKSSPILFTERLARSWSWCTGSQPVRDFYVSPGLRSLSQPKNVTVLRPVPSYIARWQRHIGVNNLPKVVTQPCPSEIEPMFLPGLRSPFQPKNVTVLRPVPSYIAWWQRHIGVNNMPKVVTQPCPGGNWTHDVIIASLTLYVKALQHLGRLWCDNYLLLLLLLMMMVMMVCCQVGWALIRWQWYVPVYQRSPSGWLLSSLMSKQWTLPLLLNHNIYRS